MRRMELSPGSARALFRNTSGHRAINHGMTGLFVMRGGVRF